MTDPEMIALIGVGSAVGGALAGSIPGVIVQLFSGIAQRRQERLSLAVQLGIRDHEARIDALKSGLLPKGQRALPLALYVDYNARVLDQLHSGMLTPKSLKRLHEAHTEVKIALDELPPYVLPTKDAMRD